MRFQGEILHWGEISGGGRNPTLVWDLRGEILHWGEISGEKFYTGVRFPGGILHWGVLSGGEILLWDIKRGNLALG